MMPCLQNNLPLLFGIVERLPHAKFWLGATQESFDKGQ